MSPSANAPSDNARTALLAGATGLVGGLGLRRLLAGSFFQRVVAVVRRPLPGSDERLQTIVTDFDQLGSAPPVPARVALCALGTTMAKAGSKEAFRRVDHDAVLAFARWARTSGAATFVLVSSAGASAKATTFYLRVKGETERDLEQIGFARLVILRPGLLLGERAERRPGEAIGQAVLRRLNPLLRGPMRRFRGIAAEQVAAAMLTAAMSDEPGRFIWNNEAIEAAATAPTRPEPTIIPTQPQQTRV